MKSLCYPLAASFLALLLLVASAPALADPPPWAGARGHDKGFRKPAPPEKTDPHSPDFRFSDAHRQSIQNYYAKHASKRCPPGLAKKNNGCLPPGQARKWVVGQPLPKEAVFYPLPRELRIELPPPPPNHQYVRIAADILLVATGSRMVVDALQDIVR